MFLDMLQSLKDTSHGYELEVIAVIDEDEESAGIAVGMKVHIVDFCREKRGALKAWNTALFLSKGSIIVPAGDDQIFHPNWLDYALESHREKLNGYGVVGMNDMAYDGNLQLATMFLFDRKYCKEVMGGIFAPPMYRYYCIDSEWNEKAKKHGAFFWDERAKVEHLHSAHNKRPVDSIDLEKQGWMEEDNKTFEERKTQGFPVTWQPII